LTKKNVKSYEKNIAVVTLNGSAVQKIILKYFPHSDNVKNTFLLWGLSYFLSTTKKDKLKKKKAK
jgi:hypothetical protein